MLTRRQVLFGRLTQGAPQIGALQPTFGEFCLPRQGVVCRSCGEACAPAAIVFRPGLGGVSHPELKTERCTSCGDCVSVCPVSALSLAPTTLDRIPEELPA